MVRTLSEEYRRLDSEAEKARLFLECKIEGMFGNKSCIEATINKCINRGYIPNDLKCYEVAIFNADRKERIVIQLQLFAEQFCRGRKTLSYKTLREFAVEHNIPIRGTI